MRFTNLPVPLIGLIAVTRGMLGAGAGLLAADRLTREQRMKLGKVLLGIGIATTAPLVWAVFKRARD